MRSVTFRARLRSFVPRHSGVHVARTAESVLALCRSTPGNTEADCQEVLADFMVNGVFCDGNVVLDSTGKHCIPAAVVDAKLALQQDPTGAALIAKANAINTSAADDGIPSWVGWALLGSGIAAIAMPKKVRVPFVVGTTVLGAVVLFSKR
jgi:hypothetical protein